MGPLIVKFGVAYKELQDPNDSILAERFEVDYDDYNDVIHRAIHLLDNGKLSVVMFSYCEGLDTSRINWEFVAENEFLPSSREEMISFFQNMLEHNEKFQYGGQYPQSGFQTQQEEKAWMAGILKGTMDLVRTSDDIGYYFMEKYYSKHPQAQGYDRRDTKE